MHPDGYKALTMANIKPIEPKYTRENEGEKYDLVYLGTAGTGKKGNSNLSERFIWHIKPHHTESNICHGFLSTLRAGLGALISNDLIFPNTKTEVNDFMKQYMKVFWIEYPNDIELIDNDEKILIKILKPLFNIKNNSNAKSSAIDNVTKQYRKRRNEVAKATKKRLECNGEDEKTMKSKNPTDNAISYEERVLVEEANCVEYTLQKDEDISVITRGIKNMPSGRLKIEIYNSLNCDQKFDWWRFNGTSIIYKYFSNDNTKEPYKGKRSTFINKWMEKKNIEEITVRVCPIN
jgi:hypothetical protein